MHSSGSQLCIFEALQNGITRHVLAPFMMTQYIGLHAVRARTALEPQLTNFIRPAKLPGDSGRHARLDNQIPVVGSEPLRT